MTEFEKAVCMVGAFTFLIMLAFLIIFNEDSKKKQRKEDKVVDDFFGLFETLNEYKDFYTKYTPTFKEWTWKLKDIKDLQRYMYEIGNPSLKSLEECKKKAKEIRERYEIDQRWVDVFGKGDVE